MMVSWLLWFLWMIFVVGDVDDFVVCLLGAGVEDKHRISVP